jgi:hypothetical protein
VSRRALRLRNLLVTFDATAARLGRLVKTQLSPVEEWPVDPIVHVHHGDREHHPECNRVVLALVAPRREVRKETLVEVRVELVLNIRQFPRAALEVHLRLRPGLLDVLLLPRPILTSTTRR